MATKTTPEEKLEVINKVMDLADKKGIPQREAAEQLGYKWSTIGNFKQSVGFTKCARKTATPIKAKSRKKAKPERQTIAVPEMPYPAPAPAPLKAVIITGSPEDVAATIRALYVQEWGNVNGYRRITKPEGHTWESFAKLLVNSMPPQTAEHFENKIFKFIEWWKERGYADGIPDEADHALEVKKLAPSWRRVCKSLLRNDFWCKGLSFTQTKSDAYKRYLEIVKAKRVQSEFTLDV